MDRRRARKALSIQGWSLLFLFLSMLPSGIVCDRVSEDEETITRQWKLESFGIKLSPTPEVLENIDSDLRQILESTLFTFLKQHDPSFQYILLANVVSSNWNGGSRRLQQPESSTTVVFSGGVASFKSEPVDDVDALVREAIETTLAANIATPALSSIRSVTYVSTSPTAAPTPIEDEPTNIAGSTIEDYSTDSDTETRKLGKVLGSIIGVLLVLVGIAMLLSKPLASHVNTISVEDGEKPVGDAATVVEDDVMTENGDVSEMAQYGPGELLDSVSIASEWTISTNDSKAATRKKRESDSSWAQETFERDRQITLQKDMLQSEWSNVPQRRMPTQQRWGSGEAAILSFEQAHGGRGEELELYLMPPSHGR